MEKEENAKQIFEKSCRLSFPKLCRNRNVIIVNCTEIKADPSDDMSLRGHTGRQWKTIEKIVDHEDFTGMNSPLQDLRLGEKTLVITACAHRRHHSVANEECQFEVIASRMCDGDNDAIGMIDLPAQSPWKRLCSKGCIECNMTSNRFINALIKSEDLLKNLVPRRRSEAAQSSRKSEPAPEQGGNLNEYSS